MAEKPDAGEQISRVRCESDAWPFTADIGLFEARRGVGQLARTMRVALSSANRQLSPPLVYLRAARALSETLHDVTRDLVGEARARGATWMDIGRVFNVGGKAAQKRFGRVADPERLKDMSLEEAVVRQTAEAAAGPYSGLEELLEELKGATPADRLRYAAKLILGVNSVFEEAAKKLQQNEPNTDELARLMVTAKDKIIRLSLTVVADPAQWKAVAEWAGQAPNPDAANYYAPATYWYFIMRQIHLATLLILGAFGPDMNGDERIEEFMRAGVIIKQIMLVLTRDDVQFPKSPE